jgi:superfamily II DNA/RNA helicase
MCPQIPLLIATDVAARGLDIPDVEVGVNIGKRPLL